MPLDVFDEVEEIINADKSSRIGKPRKMAETYRRIREVSNKYNDGEEELDSLLKRYLPPGSSKAQIMSEQIADQMKQRSR